MEKNKKIKFAILTAVVIATLCFLIQDYNLFVEDPTPTALSEKSNEKDSELITDRSPEIETLEKKALEANTSNFKISRHGGSLQIITPSGAKLQYIDGIRSFSNGAIYYVTKIFKEQSLLLLYSTYYEGDGFNLITADGSTLGVEHFPFFSPSGNRFAVVNYNDGYSFDGWAIWEKKDGQYKEIKTQSPASIKDQMRTGVVFRKWDTDDRVLVDISYYYANQEMMCAPGSIELNNGEWLLSVDLEKEHKDCDMKPTGIDEDFKKFF